MTKKIKDYLNRNYFSSEFPLNYRIYMICSIETFFIATIAAIFNTITYQLTISTLLQWIFVLCLTVLLLISPEARFKFEKPLLLFDALVYLPFIFFNTGGYYGTAFMFTPLVLFSLTIVFSGKMRILVTSLVITVNIGCIMIQYYVPSTLAIIPDEASFISDLFVSTILSLAGLALVGTQITNSFRKKNAELSETSQRDPLTGTYNRRFLIDHLKRLNESKSYKSERISLLMLDIDFFKKTNDTFGHAIGDEVLRSFALTVQKMLRDSDILVRYGGEEFVVVLDNVDEKIAHRIAERIRIAVSEIEYHLELQTTVSIGLAMSHANTSLEDTLKEADMFLYKAKQNGRNQVFPS